MKRPGAPSRILLVNTAATGGGAARMAGSLFEHLRGRAGFDTRLAVGRKRGRPNEDVVQLAPRAEVAFHLSVTRLTGLQGLGSPIATRRLLKVVEGWNPNIIHLHNVHGYYLNLDLLSLIRRVGWDGPVVWTLHDAWPFTGRCHYFSECDRWLRGCGSCPDLRRYPRTFFDSSGLMWKRKREAFTSGSPPTLVSPSSWLAEAAARSFLRNADIRVIPNGVDTDLYRPTDSAEFRRAQGIPPHHPIVLFAANYLGVERKGGRLAADVMEQLRGEELTLVTLGTTHASLPRGQNFRHLGYMHDPRDVAQVFGAADLFCILSLEENFPTTVLEALASGTPVVGFSVGGIAEQVTPECGRLVEAENLPDVVAAIRALSGDPKRLGQMAREARERAIREYSIERFVRRHKDLYYSLLGC